MGDMPIFIFRVNDIVLSTAKCFYFHLATPRLDFDNKRYFVE